MDAVAALAVEEAALVLVLRSSSFLMSVLRESTFSREKTMPS